MFNRTKWRVLGAGTTALALISAAACTGGSDDDPDPDDGVTLTVFAQQGPGMDLSTNSFTEVLRKEFDIDFDFQTTPYDSTAAAEARQISLASGDLPDVYSLIPWVDQFQQTELLNLADQGVLIPLNDLIAEHAPNIVQAFEDHPEYEAFTTAPDGNIYGLPQWNDCFHCSYQAKLWMNTDWLDTLGLEMPTTTDEMRTVLNAFLTQDPNGNGEADEIPVSGSVGLNRIMPYFMNAFIYDPLGGESTTLSLALDGDEVVSQATQDGWRDGLEYLTTLYADGVIDPGAFSQNTDALQAKGDNAEVALLGSGTALHPANFVTIEDEIGRHAQYDPVPPLVGPDGTQFTTFNFPSAPGAMYTITASATDEEQIAAIQVADFLFTQEGQLLGQFGTEGIGWVPAEEGDIALDTELDPLFTALQVDTEDPASANGMWGPSGQLYSPPEFRNTQVQPMDIYHSSGYERRLFDATQLYVGHEPTDQIFPYWNVWVSLESSSELATLQTNVESYIEQSSLEFITGQRDITDDGAWASYLDGFQGLGLDRYLEIYQTAYEESVS